jgi:hypothetical protein
MSRFRVCPEHLTSSLFVELMPIPLDIPFDRLCTVASVAPGRFVICSGDADSWRTTVQTLVEIHEINKMPDVEFSTVFNTLNRIVSATGFVKRTVFASMPIPMQAWVLSRAAF